MLVVLRAISAYDQTKEDSSKPWLRDVSWKSLEMNGCANEIAARLCGRTDQFSLPAASLTRW
jgi:hypothetical protein